MPFLTFQLRGEIYLRQIPPRALDTAKLCSMIAGRCPVHQRAFEINRNVAERLPIMTRTTASKRNTAFATWVMIVRRIWVPLLLVLLLAAPAVAVLADVLPSALMLLRPWAGLLAALAVVALVVVIARVKAILRRNRR